MFIVDRSITNKAPNSENSSRSNFRNLVVEKVNYALICQVSYAKPKTNRCLYSLSLVTI